MRFLLMLPVFAVALIFISLTDGCSRCSRDNAVPRRTAYPRIELYDSVYRDAAADLPAKIMVNDSTVVDVTSHSPEATWIDVRYPRYGATLRLTLSRLDKEALLEALANRYQRTMLNAGGMQSNVSELTSLSGISAEVIATPGAMVTPLQIIATDSVGFLLTGALEMPPSENEAEYYTPIIEGVERDLIHMAKTLEQR
jgi:hypothetical protein